MEKLGRPNKSMATPGQCISIDFEFKSVSLPADLIFVLMFTFFPMA